MPSEKPLNAASLKEEAALRKLDKRNPF